MLGPDEDDDDTIPGDPDEEQLSLSDDTTDGTTPDENRDVD